MQHDRCARTPGIYVAVTDGGQGVCAEKESIPKLRPGGRSLRAFQVLDADPHVQPSKEHIGDQKDENNNAYEDRPRCIDEIEIRVKVMPGHPGAPDIKLSILINGAF